MYKFRGIDTNQQSSANRSEMKPAHTDFTQTQTNRKRKLNQILPADLHRGRTNLGKQPQQDLIRGSGFRLPAGGAAERQRTEKLETDFKYLHFSVCLTKKIKNKIWILCVNIIFYIK